MQIGIRSSVGPPIARFGAAHLAIFTDAGFDLVELNFNHLDAGLVITDVQQARELRRAAERLDVTLLAHAPDGLSLSLPDRAKVQEHTRRFQSYIDAIARYGVRGVVIHACGYAPLVPGQETRQQANLTESLCVLASHSERLQLPLRVETLVPGRLTSRTSIIVQVLTAVNSRWVGICLDTNHININEDLSKAIATAAPFLTEVHLSDNHGVREEHLLPYRGVIAWSSVARDLAAANFDGPAVMEPSRHSDASLSTVLHEAKQIAQQLGKEVAPLRCGPSAP